MSVKYGLLQHARDKISGSIVSFQGRPVFVSDIDSDGVASFSYVGSRRSGCAPYGELDLTPVLLGNINYSGGVVYAVRVPKRRDWRQGLRSNNFFTDPVGGIPERRGPNILSSQGLVNTIQGIYPSMEFCMDSVGCGEAEGMAFSRNFSLYSYYEGEFDLHWKTKKVGKISSSGRTIRNTLSPKFQYLSEMLGQEMNLE